MVGPRMLVAGAPHPTKVSFPPRDSRSRVRKEDNRMIDPRRSSYALLGITLAALLGLVLDGTAAGEETKPTRESIHARVVAMGPGPNTGYLTVWVDRYTPDDELARWAQAFREGGQNKLVAVWQQEQPVVGRVKFAETLGSDLRVARSVATEKGRKITLVTDRPLAGVEAMRDLRSEDYPIGWIEVEVDEKGRGEGILIAAAQLEVDEEGKLTVEGYAIQPVKLLQVKVKVKVD